MSGFEAIAVIGVVAALVTAFKDSSSIANAIKQRRKNKDGALPPTVELEEALAEGEQEIHKAAAAGIRRFGPLFVEEDLEAKVALQTVVIQVQASMLRDLSAAVQDDSVTDFSHVIDASTEARMEAVNILSGLYLRKRKQALSPAVEHPPQIQSSCNIIEPTQSPPQQRSHPISVPGRSLDIVPPLRSGDTEKQRRKSGNGMQPTDSEGPDSKQEQQRSSWKRKLSGWTHSYVDDQISKGYSPTRMEQPADPIHAHLSNTSSSLGRTFPSPTQTHTYPMNPWAEAHSLTDSDSRHSIHSIQSQHLNRQETRLSAQATKISPENAFSGFCEGAYHLQVGLTESGLKKKNDSVSFTGQGQYYACRGKRCVFEGPAVQYQQEGWSYDKNLRSRPGLKYRWLFLAKSHVPQSRVRNKLFDFKCLLCTLLGDDSSTFHGAVDLLEHVVGHAGGQLAGITLAGPLILDSNSVTQAQDDNFDICFVSGQNSSFLDQPSPTSTSTYISSDVFSVDDPYDTMSTFNPKWT